MAPEFICHFVEVDGRLVHYARGGAGPAVAMLHASPQSHRALLPLGRRLADHFTVFAFDTPGYGASDPLPGTPDIAAFGDALAATLRVLGVGPVPVYGTHTGAGIALEAANRHPALVSRAVLDGFALFTPAERDDLLRDHLPPLRTEWDGSHMAALWSRVSDQAVFFPWFRHQDSARRTGDRPPVGTQHQAALDLLHAGSSYASAYGASIRHDGNALCVAPDRVRLFYRTTDVLIDHLERLPAGFPRQNARAIGPTEHDAIIASLAEARSCHAPPPTEPARRHYHANLHVRVLGEGRPVLLLHDLPGAAQTALPLARALAPHHTVIVPDLPGHGLSPQALGQDDPAMVARLVAGVTQGPVDIIGIGMGALMAPLVSRHVEVRRIALVECPDFPNPAYSANYPVDVTPRWDGSHMLAAWFRQRDAMLFRPWFDRQASAAIPLGTMPDLPALQDRVTAMLDANGPDLVPVLLREAPFATHAPTRSFASQDAGAISAWLHSDEDGPLCV